MVWIDDHIYIAWILGFENHTNMFDDEACSAWIILENRNLQVIPQGKWCTLMYQNTMVNSNRVVSNLKMSRIRIFEILSSRFPDERSFNFQLWSHARFIILLLMIQDVQLLFCYDLFEKLLFQLPEYFIIIDIDFWYFKRNNLIQNCKRNTYNIQDT